MSEHSLSADSLYRLLGVALSENNAPLQQLLTLLDSGDGEEWFEQTLDAIASKMRTTKEALASSASEGEARELKRTAKTMLRHGTPGERLAAYLHYYLALALGLHHHRTLITSASRSEVDSVLEELADIVPRPWDELLLSAASARTE